MWISFNFHIEWKGGNGGSWRSSSWPGEPGSPSVTGRSCCHSVYRRPVPSIPPPPLSNSISPTKSNTLHNKTHYIKCQKIWNPVKSKRSSARQNGGKDGNCRQVCKNCKTAPSPQPLNQPTLGRGHTLVACGRSSIDRHSPPPDRNFADLLLIDTGCRLLPDFVHQTPDICQLICPPGSSQPLFQHL